MLASQAFSYTFCIRLSFVNDALVDGRFPEAARSTWTTALERMEDRMHLRLSLLKDELPFPSEPINAEDDVVVARSAFLAGEQRLSGGIVHLADARALPSSPTFEEGAALICAGRPGECYLSSRLPMLVLPESADLAVVSNELGRIFQKYNDLETRLDDSLIRGCGLQELVDIMAPYFQNELSVVDSNHLILAHSYDSFRILGRADSEAPRNSKMVPLEIIGFFANNKRWVEMKTETQPFIYDEGIFDQRLLCVNIISDVEFNCRVMVGESDHPFRPYDEHLLTFFAGYVRKAHERTLDGRESREIYTLHDALRAVLNGDEVEPWRLKHGLSVMGHAKGAQLICICIRPEYLDDSTDTIAYFCSQMNRLFPGAAALEFNGNIICLGAIDRYGPSPDSFLKAVTPFVRDNNFRLGASEPFTDITLFKDHYRQAEIALTYGIEERPSQWVHRFHEQAVNYMMRQAGKETGIRALCAQRVLALHDYDTANQSSYIETMDCYFENHLSITRTAEALKVHRATMVYRVKRIEEICGIDFQDAERNLFYQLSIRLLMLME